MSAWPLENVSIMMMFTGDCFCHVGCRISLLCMMEDVGVISGGYYWCHVCWVLLV